ncbi:hypothetical protein BN11_520027 [Nostocoides australiense Ben110]|uniref:Uncharacterized protein n=1 Tax=Nostocoides australiense Ben110 TaxID=1193182 RepID=W6K113_9MICO|nr:hypothetical protein [Tetrasphaera australiensis]CCH75152.1 hypothetical protein BN11_520027 [Tetrasphaera australiensis Ben110]
MTGRDDQARAFYAARDRRTLQYGATEAALSRPVSLSIQAEIATTPSGRTALLALVDMLFRVHRNIRLDLHQANTAASDQLEELAFAAAAAIDPFQNPRREPIDGELRLHLTTNPETSDADVVGTWSGGRGEVHIHGARPEVPASAPHGDDGDLLGAATAACLAAATTFALVHDREPSPAAINLLTRTSDVGATEDTAVGPIDAGNVDVIGGGAVGHALTYWANVFNVAGRWEVIDGDDAEIHNTNRCMGMTVADAGWPDGLPTGQPSKKAASAARNCGAAPIPFWYHDLPVGRSRPDLVLVLANEHGIRETVAQSGEPLLLHATTSPNWTAELHRHVPGRDDCPACRIPSKTQATFLCSEGPANPSDQDSDDAALPFLSATAGLMLCTALLDLSSGRRVLDGRTNHWLVHLELPTGPAVQYAIHRGGACRHHLAPGVRRAIQAKHPRRWDSVDDSEDQRTPTP